MIVTGMSSSEIKSFQSELYVGTQRPAGTRPEPPGRIFVEKPDSLGVEIKPDFGSGFPVYLVNLKRTAKNHMYMYFVYSKNT